MKQNEPLVFFLVVYVNLFSVFRLKVGGDFVFHWWKFMIDGLLKPFMKGFGKNFIIIYQFLPSCCIQSNHSDDTESTVTINIRILILFN